ncbi:MAG: peptide chain release factor N(5)-glutamine methyltransferase [Phycisphaerales bacterium]|nr:peptide chain release factor N(5)-glutamine methyltransferase [Phycisphaerales bacterium]
MQDASSNAAPWTVARLLDWTRQHFQRQGIESPRLCAEILLAHALGCPRIQLYARFEFVPDAGAMTVFRDAVREAGGGKPIAYLTGAKEFFSLSFDVTPDVLIPRPETEMIVERAIDWVRRSGQVDAAIVDIGTGSGCIAVALAKHLPAARLFASDMSETALAVARRNANKHGVAGRVEFRCGSLFGPWTGDGAPPAFNVVVSNPPYIAERGADTVARSVREFEPRTALFAGDDGLSIIRPLVAEAPRRIAPGGLFLMEIAYNQAAAVRELFSDAVWKSVALHRDTAGHLRVVQAHTHDAAQGGS